MAETYSAGIVTAYGAAVRGGYTGTYEQFCAEQAQFGANAAKVAQDRAAVEAATETFTTETVPGAVQTVQQTGATQVQAVEAVSETEQQQIALAGAAQETRVTQAGDDQVDAVEEAGATQVGNVNTAGTTQVGNVNTAGAAQVNAVNAKGQEVIDSIPADYTELSDDVADLKSALNEAIEDFAVPTQEAVDNWLDAHPEATTTVQDGSLTEQKFSESLKGKTINAYVTYRQFGAKLDGVSDDSAAVIAAHTYANEHGLPVVESGGSLYLNFSVNVKTSCFLSLDMIMDENSAANSYVIVPDESKTVSFSGSIASGNFGVVAPVSDLYGMSAKVTLDNANWDLGVRSGTPSDAVHYYHSQLLAYDEQGNVISSGLYTENTGDFDFSNVHSLATKSIEFSGANVITKFTNNGVGFKTLVRCIRNNTVIKNITVRNDGTTPTAQINNGGSIILLRDCANVIVENVNGFNNSIHPYPNPSSTFSPVSYVYDVYDCFNTTFRNMDLSKGWGAGATHFVDNTYFVDCNISRIDNHYGCFGNFVIRDCSFNGLSIVNLGYGDANVVIDGCRFYQGSQESSAVTTRTDFTHRFCGKLAIKNTIIRCSSSLTPIYFYPNVPATGNFPTNQADISIESTKHFIPSDSSVAVYTYQIAFSNTDDRKQTVTISNSYVHGVSMPYNGTLFISNCRLTKAKISASNFFISNCILKLVDTFPTVTQIHSGCGSVSDCLIQFESATPQIRKTNALSLIISGCTFYGSYDAGYPFVRAWNETVFDTCSMGVALTIDSTAGTPVMNNININSALSNLSVDSLLE